MPSKTIIRKWRENSYYHVMNSGVGRREVFLEKKDYETFLEYLKIYTADPETVKLEMPEVPKRLLRKNLFGEVRVASFCLLPNHFHLLIKQRKSGEVAKLLKQLTNAYTTYFNQKYWHKGAVFGGRYKAVLVEGESLIFLLSRFIHLHPLISKACKDPRDYLWSSINDHTSNNELLNRFSGVGEWDRFNLDMEGYKASISKVEPLTIDQNTWS